MLSISEFSAMCHLPPQTLRFYHSAGLLVPAEVDEQTGYRSYTFEQVEQAMLITALRGAGLSVKLVRHALDNPDAAPALLHQHTAEVQRQRQAQDEAIRDAHEFFTSWPEVRLRGVPDMTVVSKLAPGTPSERDQYDWDEANAAVTATVQSLVRTVESCGAAVAGIPWYTMATDTPEQKRRSITAEGPHWSVKVPVTADGRAVAALRGAIEVQNFEARQELSIFMSGRNSMAKYATALSHLLTHPLEAAYVDLSRMRHLVHENGVETAVAICELKD